MDNTCYYEELFTRLNINKKLLNSSEIYTDNKDFYDNYAKTLNVNNHNKVIKIKYKFKKHNFIIYEDINSNGTAYGIYYENEIEDPKLCLLLFVNINEKYIFIDNRSHFEKRVSKTMPKIKKGVLLIEMAEDFIKKIIKLNHELDYIKFQDNSFLLCENMKIEFDIFYMLTSGDIWFADVYFHPFDQKTKLTNWDLEVEYKINKKLVDYIYIKSIKLFDKVRNTIDNLDLKKSFRDLEFRRIFEFTDDDDISVQMFLYYFVKEYDKTCIVFQSIYKDLMREIRMNNFHGVYYYHNL